MPIPFHAVYNDATGLLQRCGYSVMTAGAGELLVTSDRPPVCMCTETDWTTDQVTRWTGSEAVNESKASHGLVEPSDPWV